jgi:O-6-methylguanine DNA methyltransferase
VAYARKRFAQPRIVPSVVDSLQQIEDFFAGRPTAFDCPLDMAGTPFQLRVWEALKQIPYGQTMTYGQLAAKLGRPNAARAVGGACGANPIPIVVPCHRVLASNGGLGGYGGGLEWKQWLLDLEGSRAR